MHTRAQPDLTNRGFSQLFPWSVTLTGLTKAIVVYLITRCCTDPTGITQHLRQKHTHTISMKRKKKKTSDIHLATGFQVRDCGPTLKQQQYELTKSSTRPFALKRSQSRHVRTTLTVSTRNIKVTVQEKCPKGVMKAQWKYLFLNQLNRT